MEPAQRIGLFGGTFDPVHNGHLALARQARHHLGLDSVWFLPAAGPPHKIGSPITSFDHRVAMLEIALSDTPDFHVSLLEAELAIPSFTIDTLHEFQRRLDKRVALYFLMGMDSFAEIESWKDFSGLVDCADLVVLPRMPAFSCSGQDVIERAFPGYRFDPATSSWRHEMLAGKGGIHILPNPISPVSSSQVRAELVAGRPVIGLVPEAVISYIRDHRLYQPAAA